MADEGSGDGGVEILGPDPGDPGFDRSPTAETSESLFTPRSSRLLIIGGVVAVVLALAVISRPGGDSTEDAATSEIRQVEPAEQDQDTGERADAEDGPPGDEDGSQADEDPENAVTAPEEPPPPPQLPSLRSDLPDELAGTLLIASRDRMLVGVRWEDSTLEDLPFPELPVDVADETAGEVAEVRPVGHELFMRTGVGLLQLTGTEIFERPANLRTLLPSDSGLTFVVDEPQPEQVVFALPAPDADPVSQLEPLLYAGDLTLIGQWRGQMLVAKAGKVWLMTGESLDGTPATVGSLVAEGEVLVYDGAHLAMLRCSAPADCRIDVGPPDNPRRMSIPVPEQLAGRDPAGWGPSTTISADGRHVAVVDDVGAFSAPLLIDMQLAETTVGSDIVNGDSPLAWSPDGRFLTYAFGDDLVLRDELLQRVYRIDIDRPIDHLVWVDDKPEV